MIMGLFLSWNVDFNVDITFILWMNGALLLKYLK